MAMKCYTKFETAKERCPIVFQGHPSNFKVTQDKTSPILTQIGRFRTIGRSQLSNPSDLPCLWIRSLIHFLDCYCYGLHGISCHIGPCYHGTELYNDVTVQWCHNERDDISNHQPQDCLLQVQIEENIKAPHHWPLWGEFIGDRWIPHTKASNPEKCFHSMTSSWRTKKMSLP